MRLLPASACHCRGLLAGPEGSHRPAGTLALVILLPSTLNARDGSSIGLPWVARTPVGALTGITTPIMAIFELDVIPDDAADSMLDPATIALAGLGAISRGLRRLGYFARAKCTGRWTDSWRLWRHRVRHRIAHRASDALVRSFKSRNVGIQAQLLPLEANSSLRASKCASVG